MLYNLGIHLFGIVLKILSAFNLKVKKGCLGRSESFTILENCIELHDKTFWFHCASLGEYEQGLPVFQILKEENTDYKIVLTFFSPSGYEIRKNTELADVVVYLPLDTRDNAKKFIDLVNPSLTIFVKYEIWPNYLKELRTRNLKSILISGLFRQKQVYFKWYGKILRNALRSFSHIFVQDERSKQLLYDINIENVTISGDTRYDRVYNQLIKDNQLNWLNRFKKDSTLIVFGSIWSEDENIIVPYINNTTDTNIKFLIVPHEIHESHIKKIEADLKLTSKRYSQMQPDEKFLNVQVLILDTIGLLTKVYSYADIAYVGGAMGTSGLHNILEPAVFGVPIIIGHNYNKFPEAKEMKRVGGLYSVKDFQSLNSILDKMVEDQIFREKVGNINREFIEKNKGAVIQVMDYIRI